jgi:type III secretory pathway component EscU
MFWIIVIVVYVVVEVIDFLVAIERDAKSMTIPDETGKAR